MHHYIDMNLFISGESIREDGRVSHGRSRVEPEVCVGEGMLGRRRFGASGHRLRSSAKCRRGRRRHAGAVTMKSSYCKLEECWLMIVL